MEVKENEFMCVLYDELSTDEAEIKSLVLIYPAFDNRKMTGSGKNKIKSILEQCKNTRKMRVKI